MDYKKYKKLTIEEIKQHVLKNGGTFERYIPLLNPRFDAYRVNGLVYTSTQLKEAYVRGHFND